MAITTPPASATLPALNAALPRLQPAERSRLLGMALQIVGVLVLGLILQALVISPLHYARDQHIAYGDLRYQLANGTAPVGQVTGADRLVTPGTAMAIIKIPRLGLNDVVFEGTTSRVLLSGPGHRRDTVLPGQSGASVIMGRQSAYGGPLGQLDQLKVGDSITTITGQGEATYRVSSIRRAGDPLPPVLTGGSGRLTLVSATGMSFLPEGVLRVDANLTSPAFDTPQQVVSGAELSDAESAFVGDPSAWPWLVVWLAVLTLAIVGFILLRLWWGRAQSWIVGLPVLLLVTALVGEQVFILLPNLI